ncbi:DUF2809 domain-containing protein [Paenibacillus sp. Marseille-Q4541]|uniref:ribosomal maturation YjgA family protein n=1 Tax=Paenibacillus sp. Marseille-Q4541 TaxID=2831522 RepID=UPI001BA63E4F|nr:DUF2809 domain-containing protein [Paenibacillus sp. Marseille-Q4541]
MKRIIIGMTCILIIMLGLTFRSIPFIGDFLWAVLIFFLFSFVFLHVPRLYKLWIPLLFCYVIEFSQLYHAPWINMLREDAFLQLILGHGFFGVSDLVAYTLAIVISYIVSGLIKQRWESKPQDNIIEI